MSEYDDWHPEPRKSEKTSISRTMIDALYFAGHHYRYDAEQAGITDDERDTAIRRADLFAGVADMYRDFVGARIPVGNLELALISEAIAIKEEAPRESSS